MSSQEMLSDFVEIARAASGASGRIFSEWTAKPERFLKGDSTGVESILRRMGPEEIARARQLIDYFSKTTTYYLLKYLEEGEAGYSFDVLMKNDETGESLALVSGDVDLNIRKAFI